MAVVHQRVAYSGIGQIGRQLRLPNPLGKPEPPGVYPEAVTYGFVHPLDLLHPIGTGERRQHGLVEPGEEQLHPSIADEPPEEVEVPSVVRLQPLEQRAGEMQDHGEKISSGKALQNRPIDVSDMLLEDMIEVADWLMEMEAEDKPECGHKLAYDQ
jgi:hypothetical protein